MSERQRGSNIAHTMSEGQPIQTVDPCGVIVFEIPNEETEAAMEEAEELLNDSHAMAFSSVDELLAELRSCFPVVLD